MSDHMRPARVGRVTVTVAPTGPAVLLEDARRHLRVDHTDEDADIERHIGAAASELDVPTGWLGRSLIHRTLRLSIDGRPPSLIALPGPPVTDVVSVQYRDLDGDWITIPVDEYHVDLDSEPARLWPLASDGIRVGAWPADMLSGQPDSLRVTYEAGYADATVMPTQIRDWILLRVGELYRDREGSVIGTIVAPHAYVDRILDNLRVR